MDILLYTNLSPDIMIHKNINPVATLTGTLRDESNIVNPTIRVEYPYIPVFNYAYIPSFNRYYFARDVRVVRNNIFDISLQSDVLMSFDLSAVTGVVIESSGGSNYLPARNWVRTVKTKTDILPFSNGLLSSGEYILVTAGG
jgi:hypothetical protein